MGFFKKLKERLFGLKENDNIKNNDLNKNEISEEKFSKSTKEKNETILNEKENTKEEIKLIKKQEKLAKKEKKELNKQLNKEKKINKYVAGLSKSGTNLTKKIRELQSNHKQIDEEFLKS